MNQLALPLHWPADAAAETFVVGKSNAGAVHQLDRWNSWPVMAAVLSGPRKSGRSLLARLFAARTSGRVVDDAERMDEVALFNAWNQAQSERRPLLIVVDAPPPLWPIELADLRSRLMASPRLEIGSPDEPLMHELFERAFLRRGIDARPDLIAWIVPRVERTHFALLHAVDLLDAALLASHRRLSIPFARATLLEAGLLNADVADPGVVVAPSAEQG